MKCQWRFGPKRDLHDRSNVPENAIIFSKSLLGEEPANYTIKHPRVHDCAATSQKNKIAKIIHWCLGYIFINAEIGTEGNCVRRFVIPATNFGATDYVDLIDLQTFYVTPPPVLRLISSHELLQMIQDDVPIDSWNFIKFPSNTQAVERIVKLVTEATRRRVGPQNRDGFIRAILKSIK
ncbi:hypothetical protein AVEN_251164-1 [Araneus ventricosus]|uniref:Uncharacterized protein n=1 Tax=Araneus ventricosus TaxID=182803 RepID=A0A4Y2I7K0_ARAVE|nr:hypothetical protein AVEN_251164-1 [Araneus ventricosus]